MYKNKFQDTKGIMRSSKAKKDIQYNGRKKKNKRTYNTMAERKRTKGQTIQWPKEKEQIQWPTEKEQNDIQYNGRKKKNKRTNNNLQNTT